MDELSKTIMTSQMVNKPFQRINIHWCLLAYSLPIVDHSQDLLASESQRLSVGGEPNCSIVGAVVS